jgi:hypothetical protein
MQFVGRKEGENGGERNRGMAVELNIYTLTHAE